MRYAFARSTSGLRDDDPSAVEERDPRKERFGEKRGATIATILLPTIGGFLCGVIAWALPLLWFAPSRAAVVARVLSAAMLECAAPAHTAAGLLAVPNMRAQYFPDVIEDEIEVSVSWEGAGAEDVDSGIVQLLEPVLLAVDGVVSTRSVSRGQSARPVHLQLFENAISIITSAVSDISSVGRIGCTCWVMRHFALREDIWQVLLFHDFPARLLSIVEPTKALIFAT